MKTLHLFTSLKSFYSGHIEKIKSESPFDVNVIYIEDYAKNNDVYDIDKDDIVYFLCSNSSLIDASIKLLETTNCKIINHNFYSMNYTKKDIQLLLKKSMIECPNVYDIQEKSIAFPVFLKENMHEGIVTKVYNKVSLERLLNNLNKDCLYLEEEIKSINEEKIYYVENKTFTKTKEIKSNHKIAKLCFQISKILSLNLFSIDIIKNKNTYYVIDVNIAPGFYLSNKARKHLIETINLNF